MQKYADHKYLYFTRCENNDLCCENKDFMWNIFSNTLTNKPVRFDMFSNTYNSY